MEIVAVLAHEIQHFIGKHSLNHIYAANKKERNNKMWAEIGGALAATAVAYSGAYNSTYSSYNNEQYQQHSHVASGNKYKQGTQSVPYLLTPLLLHIKAGAGFIGKFIMAMNRG